MDHYDNIIKKQEQIINELKAKNQTLSEMVEALLQNNNRLLQIIESAGIFKNVAFFENKIEVIGSHLLSRAKEFHDKGAAIGLLLTIRDMVQNGRAIKGSYAEYLISAINFIYENPKLADAPKKAFLLTGVSSKFGQKRKIGKAMELSLIQGFKKHKSGKLSAYTKVANEMNLSVSNVEKLYNEYVQTRDDIEPGFEKVIDVVKATQETVQKKEKNGILSQAKAPETGVVDISTKDKN